MQKTAESTVDFLGNKIADKITSISKKNPDNNNNNDDDDDIELTTPKVINKRYISPEGRQQIIDELRLVPKN